MARAFRPVTFLLYCGRSPDRATKRDRRSPFPFSGFGFGLKGGGKGDHTI